MPMKTLTDAELLRTIKAVAECGGTTGASHKLKLNESTVRRHIRIANQRGLHLDERPRKVSKEARPLSFPEFPSGQPEDDVLLDHMCRQFDRQHKAFLARKWFEVGVNMDGPIGIAWMGDPHVDSDGCNWPLLREHAAIMAETEGLFAANIGDTTDNWIGRLQRLYAHSGQSRETAVQLAEILISKLGIDWILLLRGNHDMWAKSKPDDPLTWMQRGGAPMEDWQAQFKLRFLNGRKARIWAAHDFPGHSLWNPLHGPQRSAKTRAEADLYVCGHKHNYAMFSTQDGDRGNVYWLARARGYKFIDMHAEVNGYASQSEGASIVSVFNPDATSPAGFLQCFADVGAAADFLTFLRRRWASNKRVAA